MTYNDQTIYNNEKESAYGTYVDLWNGEGERANLFARVLLAKTHAGSEVVTIVPRRVERTSRWPIAETPLKLNY